MKWLADNCHVTTVEKAIQLINSGIKKDKPLVCVTFDDGYYDNYEIATPILEKNNLQATFYVTTDFITSNRSLWHDKAANIWMHTDPIDINQKCTQFCLKGEVEGFTTLYNNAAFILPFDSMYLTISSFNSSSLKIIITRLNYY